MNIQKNGKIYSVTEKTNSWIIKCRNGAIALEYKVDKEICATLDALRAYVESEKLF